MTDFVNKLQHANEYLDRTTVDIPTNVTADVGTGTVSTSYTSLTARELICSLLAGNGLKLPNLQICLKVNIGRMLNDPDLAPLYNALSELDRAMDDFIDHTKIDNVLGRLNQAIAEFAAIANMINFCGTPVTPRAIPNVLRDMTGSLTGAGKNILDSIGTMLDSDIGGCIGADGKVNFGIFNGGILKDIGDQLNQFGSIPATSIAGFNSQIMGLTNDLNNLVRFENNFKSNDGLGGSSFVDMSTRVHTGVGVGIDLANMNMRNAQSTASALQYNYNALKGYSVDENGNNIFYYMLEPELIAKLDAQDTITPEITEQRPILDYCGKVIGYEDITVSPGVGNQSAGTAASIPNQPGVQGLSEASSGQINIQDLQDLVNQSSDFNDFKNKINNL